MEKQLCFNGTFEVRKLLKQTGPWGIFEVSPITEPSKRFLLFKFILTANVEEDKKRFNQEFRYLYACRTMKSPLLPIVYKIDENSEEYSWLLDWFDGLPLSKVMEMGSQTFSLEKAITWTIHFAELFNSLNNSSSGTLWFHPPLESNILLTSSGEFKVLPKAFYNMMAGKVHTSDTASLPALDNLTTATIRGLVAFLYFLIAKIPLSSRKSCDEQLVSVKMENLYDLEELIKAAIDDSGLPSSYNALILFLEKTRKKMHTIKNINTREVTSVMRLQSYISEWRSQIAFFLSYRILRHNSFKTLDRIRRNLLFIGNIFLEANSTLMTHSSSYIKSSIQKLRKLTWKEFCNIIKQQTVEGKQQYVEIMRSSKDIFKDIMTPLDKQLIIFTKELSLLLKAGVSYSRALTVLHKQTIKPSLQEAIRKTYLAVAHQGASLSASFALSPKIFSQTYQEIVRAGETTGTVDKTLNKVAELMEKNFNIKQKVKSSMTYPIIVLTVCVIIFFLFAHHVLPVFLTLFESSNTQLPLPTRILMSGVKFLHNPTLVMFYSGLSFLLLFPIFYYRRTIIGTLLYDKLKFRIPIIGKLIKLVALSQFSRTLASMYSAGISLIEAVEISGQSVGNAYLLNATKEMGESIRAGGSFSQMFMDKELFPSLVYHMAHVGDETGRVGEMLEKVSVIYDQEIDHTVEVMMAMLDPILMGILGVIVCFVVLALFLPLYQTLSII